MKKIGIVLLLCFPFVGFSLQEDQLPTELALRYFQKGEVAEVQATLLDEDGEPVSGANVEFRVTINGELLELGNNLTNEKGVATISKEMIFFRKLGHHFTFEAEFTGTNQHGSASEEREIQDAVLTVVAETIDSVNTISIQLQSWNEENELIAIPEVEVYYFIPRMFSLLPIGESYTNEEGEDQYEFPSDLPGGPAGELTLVSKVEEHEDYGTLEAMIGVTWGIPSKATALPNRALWSPDAPLWMLITFIILMTGVWFHYLFIVFNLFQIRKSGASSDEIIYAE